MSLMGASVVESKVQAFFMRASNRNSAGVSPTMDFIFRLRPDRLVAVAAAMSFKLASELPNSRSTYAITFAMNRSSSGLRLLFGLSVL